MTKYEFKKRWQATKRLWKSDEYFLVTAKPKDWTDVSVRPIEYSYDTNTYRDIFYHFIKEHIKKMDTYLNEEDRKEWNGLVNYFYTVTVDYPPYVKGGVYTSLPIMSNIHPDCYRLSTPQEIEEAFRRKFEYEQNNMKNK